MGTRSDIIVHRADGKFARVYCHWDGYIEHNGKILFEHYSDQEKADVLVAPGDMSSLGPRCDKPEGHSYDTKVEGCTVYYGRDRGETDVDATVGDSLSDVWPGSDTGTEFTYAFLDPDDGKGKRWFVGDPDEGGQTLRDLGAVLRGEDDAPKTAIKAFGGNFIIRHR